MDRDCFKALLRKATGEALEFARRFVFNRIADNVRYDIAFRDECEEAMRYMGVDAVVDVLWQDKRIPRWIDVKVKGIEHGTTIISLRVSDEYVACYDETLYAECGTGPFGVKGPIIPWPMGVVFEKRHHRFFLGDGWTQKSLNRILFLWWAIWDRCDKLKLVFPRVMSACGIVMILVFTNEGGRT